MDSLENDSVSWLEDKIQAALPSISKGDLKDVTEALKSRGLDDENLVDAVEVEDLMGILPTIKARKLVRVLKQSHQIQGM